MNLQSKFDSFFSKPINALFGSLAFVFGGWFIFQQSGPFSKVMGVVTMLFFGFGTIICIWRLLHPESSKAEAKVKSAHHSNAIILHEDIAVQKVAIDDDEVEECWRRTGHHFQYVSASRTADEKFSWSVDLASGEFFRQGQNPEYYQAIYDAISGVTGVRETGREDHEHWAVDGDCDGEELVRAVAFANDQFLKKYYE